MPVYLQVESRLDQAAAAAAAREAVRLFTRAGEEASRGFGGAMGKAFGMLDTSRARAEIDALSTKWREAQVAEAEAARQMERSLAQVEVAQRRLNEVTAKYTADSSKAMAANIGVADANARAAKAARDHADAMVATEGAAPGWRAPPTRPAAR
ncbi:hypothetical protein C1Y40_05094 [Mycobacterium talmoniae]|uniref:Uncharacterized protein n=1 Tax=Mycobacterium talmoniae TaxID=1858794 RepID=A0A2S8BDN0_9MYCO|nr:hypothetical protein C1Y40_05094 [Mycobacterium talmoniae]